MSKAQRLERLSDLREELRLDAVVLTTPGNLHYFSGFRTTLYTRFNGLVVTAAADPILITSYVDEQLAKKEIWGPVWVRDIRIHGPIQRPDVVPLYVDALKPALGGARKVGVDAITLGVAREFEAAMPGIELVEISPRLASIRFQKDEEEIGKMRRASEIGVACLEAARDILARPGVTELELGAELEFQARRMGADGWGYPILFSAGEKVAAPHAPPQAVPIARDVPFVRLGFSPMFEGYTTSLLRTYCREPNALTRRYESAFADAIAGLQAMLRPGVTVQDILKSVAATYQAHGVRSAWGGDMGYSLGVTVQEPPRIGGTDNTVIQSNCVLALMPGLRTPGEATFHHSDTFVVGEASCEALCNRLQGIVVYG